MFATRAWPAADSPRSEKSLSRPPPCVGALAWPVVLPAPAPAPGPSRSAKGSAAPALAAAVSVCIGSGNSNDEAAAAAAAGASAARRGAAAAGAGDSPASRSAKGSSSDAAWDDGIAENAAAPGCAGADAIGAAASSSTASSKPPITRRSPLCSAASLPAPSARPLHSSGLLPRSTMKNCPLRHSTCACTRETVRSGSSSISVLDGARPMVPPVMPNSADSPGAAAAPCRAMAAMRIIAPFPLAAGKRRRSLRHHRLESSACSFVLDIPWPCIPIDGQSSNSWHSPHGSHG